MLHVLTGVTVATMLTAGELRVTTVSSFASVSAGPPFALDFYTPSGTNVSLDRELDAILRKRPIT
jgi:flavin reductase (DIM6/NTAB) family NADH-FMN oxidoreductase RutF